MAAAQQKFRYFEDFAVGERIGLGNYAVSAEEIIEFAQEFDPAPFHLSEEGGKASIMGGLVASGWHTCSMAMRMMADSFLLSSSGQGSPGIDTCKWLAPVRPGDRLSGIATVLTARRSVSRPAIGLVSLRFDISNQSGLDVLTMENTIMFKRRAAISGSQAS